MATIIEKLNLGQYQHPVILNDPETGYFLSLKNQKTTFPSKSVDLIFTFVTTLMEFQEIVSKVITMDSLIENGILYIAYPKKGNKRYESYIHRDEIFPALKVNEEDGYIGESNYKFNRMVRLDETFTVVGVKHVKKKNAKKNSSARVNDYLVFVPQVEIFLENYTIAAIKYKDLPPGYKKDWARYIYSAKQEVTREKRKLEMVEILTAGFKSKELYRQHQKEQGVKK